MECDAQVLLSVLDYPRLEATSSPSAIWASTCTVSTLSDVSSQPSDLSCTFSARSDSHDTISSTPVGSSQSSLDGGMSFGGACDVGTKRHGPCQRLQAKQLHVEIPSEQRQNPRRTAASRSACPPALVRQSERKNNFVDNLVDASMHIVVTIWPTSKIMCRTETGNNGVLPLRTFIQETLRRSRTSYSTLQVALYYLLLIKARVPAHDFTTEQADDCDATRAIQCGRRMFLAALILASKYLQDRNYSARAWSKISGLGTHEINQNEMVFLLAVNWKLHIPDDVYNRWTEFVTKYTPSQPPSPGGAPMLFYERECKTFRHIMLNLTPNLDNIDELAPHSPIQPLPRDFPPMSLFTPPSERSCAFGHEVDDVPTPRSVSVNKPSTLEPKADTSCTPGRMAPALGLLPTPRLTPQATGFSTPAAGAAPCPPGKGSAMGFAMGQASIASAVQSADRLHASLTPSQGICSRRSSLANSTSNVSSPESMVWDLSRASRSSSTSSASSSVSAPAAKSVMQAPSRPARLGSERMGIKTTIATVREDDEENSISASPASHDGAAPSTRSDQSSMDKAWESCQREVDEAARALQGLHQRGWGQVDPAPAVMSGTSGTSGKKRGRTASLDKITLQENVRDILAGHAAPGDSAWPDDMVRAPSMLSQQMPSRPAPQGSHKRICCSTEVARPLTGSAL